MTLLAVGVERDAIEVDYLKSNEPHRRYKVRRSGPSPVMPPEVEELLLERPVEPLVDRVVLRGPGARPVVLQMQSRASVFEMAVELAAVVSLDIFDLAVKEQMQAPLVDVLSLMVRERLTGEAPPQIAKRAVDLWRPFVEAKVGLDLDRLKDSLRDQRAYGKLTRAILSGLELADEYVEEPEGCRNSTR